MDNQQITALKYSCSPNLAPYQIIVTKEDNENILLRWAWEICG